MKETIKKLMSILVISAMLISLYVVNISAADTSGAIVKELKNTEAVSGLEYSTTEKYEGERSIHIVNKEGEDGISLTPGSANFGIESGKSYNFSFYYKGTIDCLYVKFGSDYVFNLDCSDQGYYESGIYKGISITDAGDGWKKAEANNITATGDTQQSFMFIEPYYKKGSDFYIDNLSVYDVAAGKELIENGSFESSGEEPPAPTNEPDGSKDDDPPSTPPYINEFKETSPMLSYSSKISYEGERSLRVVPQKDGMFCDPTKIGMEKNKTYDIEFYMYADPVTDMGIFRLQLGKNWDNPNGNVMAIENCKDLWADYNYSYQKIEAVSNGWYKVSTTVPWELTGNEQGVLESIFQIQTPGKRFYIDNLSIKEHDTQKELITNGGFEDNGEEPGPSGSPVPTRKSNVIKEFKNKTENPLVAYSAKEAYDGDWSVHFTGCVDGQHLTAPIKEFGLESGKEYTVSLYYKGEINSFYLNLGENNKNVDYVVHYWLGNIVDAPETAKITEEDAGNGWKKLTLTATVQKEDQPLFRFGWTDGNVNNDFYIDQLSITDNTGKEYIKNNSFEEMEELTRKSNVIKEFNNIEENSRLSYSSDEKYEGNWSVHFTGCVDGERLTAPLTDFGLEQDKEYTVSFYYKGTIASFYVHLGENTAKAPHSVHYWDNIILDPDTVDATEEDAGDGWKKLTFKSSVQSADQPLFRFGWTQTIDSTYNDFYIDNLSITDAEGIEYVRNGGFEPPAIEVGEYKITDNGDGTKTVTVDVSNYSAEEGATAQLIVAVYNGTYMPRHAKDENPTDMGMTGTKTTLTQTVQVNAGEKVIAYLWDSVGGMNPLEPAKTLVE